MLQPIEQTLNEWIAAKKNRPRGSYQKNTAKFDAHRRAHDLECILSDGALNADLLVSLWNPLRFTLVRVNDGYAKLNAIGKLDHSVSFMKALLSAGLDQFLPSEHPAVVALAELFVIGRTAHNVMLLPNARLGRARERAPYYDYMPAFLANCFEGGTFASAFPNDAAFIEWVHAQQLTAFFEQGTVCREAIKDLAQTGDLEKGVPTSEEALLHLLTSYRTLLQARSYS